jgi:cytochrome c biogenesis protein CcdA
MSNLLEPLTQFLAVEKARLRQSLRHSLLTTALALFAALALLEGLMMILVGAYASLIRTMHPWAAGLIVGGTLILLSLILLAVIIRTPDRRERIPETPPLGARRLAEPPPPVDAPTLLKAAATELIDRTDIKVRNIALGALLAGLVLGASPGLRRQLFGRKRRS